MLALVVSATALALVVAGAQRTIKGDDNLPSSTFLLTRDQREEMAPEAQARVFQEETLARISKRR